MKGPALCLVLVVVGLSFSGLIHLTYAQDYSPVVLNWTDSLDAQMFATQIQVKEVTSAYVSASPHASVKNLTRAAVWIRVSGRESVIDSGDMLQISCNEKSPSGNDRTTIDFWCPGRKEWIKQYVFAGHYYSLQYDSRGYLYISQGA